MMVIEIMKDITLMWHNLLLLVTCNENNTRRNCGRPAFFTATIPQPQELCSPLLG